MNSEIEKQIAAIIEAAKSTGTDAVDFIKKQSPDYFAQLIRWHVWDSVLGILYGLFWGGVAAGTGFWLLPIVWHWRATGAEERTLGFALCLAAVLAVAFCAVLSISDGISQIIKAKVAPKVIILDKIQSAVRGESKCEE